MPLTSDLSINVSKFDPSSVSEATKRLNEGIEAGWSATPTWYDVGAQRYREMCWTGETGFPAPSLLPQAIDITIPSREKGRDIPCRLLYPQARKTEEERKGVKGVVCHFHGGGWVVGDQKTHDEWLQLLADVGDCVTISVGYRVAPEEPWPRGPEDCIDVGEYLVKNSESVYGAPLRFIGGESAGAHLSVVTCFHLLKTFPSFHLSGGLLLHFGCYDLSNSPSAVNFKRNLILNSSIIKHYTHAFLPEHAPEQRRIGAISPLFEDFAPFRGRLPSALFVVGTEEPLLDDTMNMGLKWLMFGGEAIVKVYPGACHGFTFFTGMKEAGDAIEDIKTYIRDRLAA